MSDMAHISVKILKGFTVPMLLYCTLNLQQFSFYTACQLLCSPRKSYNSFEMIVVDRFTKPGEIDFTNNVRHAT